MSIDGTIRLPGAPAPTQGVTGGLYDILTGGGRPEPGAGPVLLEKVQDLAGALEDLPAALTQLGDEQLTDLMGVLMRLHARAGHLAALTAADATERGTVMASDAAGPHQWISTCARDAGVTVEPRDAKTLTVIAQACREERNRVITTAVRDGACTLLTARKVIEHTPRVVKILPDLAREDIQAWFLQLDATWSSRGVEELTRALRVKYGPDELDAEDARMEDVETLTWRRLPTGMWRMTADLAPDTAAQIKQAITAGAAPRPATRGKNRGDGSSPAATGDTDDAASGATANQPYQGSFGPIDFDTDGDHGTNTDDAPDTSDGDRGTNTGDDDRGTNADATDTGSGTGTDTGSGAGSGSGAKVRDERLPGKRRVDALVDLIGAGAKVANGDGTSIGAAATLLVTMRLEDLIAGVGGASTITGDTLDPSTARRLACDADLIPIVLGTDSEPLDVGRKHRLVTGGMRAAVVHRDKGCTYAGCDRPPGFCDVHHPTPWFAGGTTSLTNGVLLCHRHHQVVHRNGYYAEVTTEGVIWDLTIGAMPGWTRAGYQAAMTIAAA